MSPIRKRDCVSALRSIYFHILHHYYGLIGLLTVLFASLCCWHLSAIPLLSGNCKASQVYNQYLDSSPFFSNAGGASPLSRYRMVCVGCDMCECIAHRFPETNDAKLIQASRFRALSLSCLRLSLTSRLRLQGWIPAPRYGLPGREFHPTILNAPNWRTTHSLTM